MPPSPGKIHSLPVKVLYSIDTSSQSYLTVLHDKHDVYIHPGSPSYGTAGEGPVGSCTLKTVARGICFASPECIPNSTSLDFSVYNLDPTVHRPSSARAFPSSPGGPSSSSSSSLASSWTGRGFLSWVLSEPGIGTTLIKGRLVREYEFSSIHFAPEGGLEGLMALANSNSGSGAGNNEDSDGKGWGLEVGISLRQLNPDGKVEFQGRKEFEEMLQKGKSTSTSSVPPTSSPIRPSNTGSTPIRSSPLINGITRLGDGGNRTPNVNSTPQNPGPSASSTATVRPPTQIAQPTPVPAGIQQPSGQSSRPSSSLSQHRPSSSSMPPSSLPALPSSSNLPSSRPSSSIGESRPQQQQTQPPLPQSVKAESSSNQAGPSTQRNREVTPPPIPRSKSPPPSTPSRSKLHALLRADGMMSPDLARHLASNPVLRNLLKAVPSNSNALTALRSITGINKSPSSNATGKGKQSTRNGPGPGSDDKDTEGNSPEATTPTPSNPPLPTPGRTTRNMQDGCCNCGTLVSSCWRMKKMKDGTPRKVCDDCGLYFNEHKHMRPPELWSQPHKPGSSSTQQPHQSQGGDTKRKHVHHEINDGPASGLRSSPRLNRTNSDKETHTIHSSSHHPHLPTNPHAHHSVIPESPRKRQKTKGAAPPPSPRRSTRASARAGGVGDHNNGIDFGAEVFGFSPTNSNSNSIYGTSPAIPIGNNLQNEQSPFQSFGNAMTSMNEHTTNHHQHQNQHYNNHGQNGNNGTGEEIDISAFLATFENQLTNNGDLNLNNDSGNNQGGGDSNENFSLENLFNGLGDGMGVELSQEMQDLLNGWESQLNDPNYLGNLGDLSGLNGIGGAGEVGNENVNGNGTI